MKADEARPGTVVKVLNIYIVIGTDDGGLTWMLSQGLWLGASDLMTLGGIFEKVELCDGVR